jgi:hypothetical protein
VGLGASSPLLLLIPLNLKEEFEKKRGKRRRIRGRIDGDAKEQELSPPPHLIFILPTIVRYLKRDVMKLGKST